MDGNVRCWGDKEAHMLSGRRKMKPFFFLFLMIVFLTGDGHCKGPQPTETRPIDGVINPDTRPTLRKTIYGPVRGTSFHNHDQFLGIPFARPPVRELRFLPPLEVLPWGPTPLNASRPGPDCHRDSSWYTLNQRMSEVHID